MKKITSVLASAVLFALTTIPAYAQNGGNVGPTAVRLPEPSSFAQIVTGLVMLVGFAILARKRFVNSK